ncbi:hypothetical protein C9374_001395 [Naegleria lovaniensis]|uniref:Serpin domain-containing protein n=1 Tax=Naegleria lovaniensis TaxID=51637 RepID=A0AA88GXL7_NAELO|nr:uncharacterized protein C9374_001395 [Naegleria lovaniensis]KAG2387801.1 hypothetical protein C9374_001395 [Naegleria lovaniensis]
MSSHKGTPQVVLSILVLVITCTILSWTLTNVECQQDSSSHSSLLSMIGSSQKAFAGNIFNSILSQQQSSSQIDSSSSLTSNMVLSPFSLFMVLSMLVTGSRGDTQQELLHALSLNQSQFNSQNLASFPEAMKEIISSYSQTSSELSIANGLFVEQTFDISQDFSNTIVSQFKSEIRKCDFVQNYENERRSINSWISDKTRNLLRDVLQPGSIESQTKLLLINAIYFLGKWKVAFNPEITISGRFRKLSTTGSTTEDSEISVQFMTKRRTLEKYGENDLYKWLRLPYSNEDFEMLFLVPKSSVELSVENEKEFIRWISNKLINKDQPDGSNNNGQNLSELFETSTTKLRIVQIPKFKAEINTLELSTILKESPFNMETSFNMDRANFSGILTQESLLNGGQLWVDKIYHKAMLKVDESGTEAAAVTVARISYRMARPTRTMPEFVLDRPFCFMLSHIPTQSVLFVGRVNLLGSV